MSQPDDFDSVWERIQRLAGSEFRQLRGQAFTYAVRGNSVQPSTVNRGLARSQFQRAHARRPLRSTSQLQDLQGPSYLFAILTDPRISPAGAAAGSRGPLLGTRRGAMSGTTVSEQSSTVRPSPDDRPLPLGTTVSRAELLHLGFQRLELRFLAVGGGHCEWDTVGEVPEAPGLYLFSLERDVAADVKVAYVGMTMHLWTVTKGHLPRGGGPRPGQRYGRPRYAGQTRARVNGLVASAVVQGWTVAHWVRPLSPHELEGAPVSAALRREEERLIRLWRVRETGWNRG